MTYCQSITQTLRIIWVKCIPLNLRSKARRRATPLLPTLDLLLPIEWRSAAHFPLGQTWQFQLPYHKTFGSWIAIFHLRQPIVFLSHSSYGMPGACSSYECFILRTARLWSKLRGQWYVMERLISSLGKFYGRYWDVIKHYEVSLSQNFTWHSRTRPYTMTTSIDQTLQQFANLLPNWSLLPILTLSPNFRGFHRTLQRVRLANRGRLLLRKPGPVPFGTCKLAPLIVSRDSFSPGTWARFQTGGA